MNMREIVRSLIVRLITLEARAVLKKHRPSVMVVTGSVGKTSTKDAVYAALKNHTFVRKSEKSYNSDIGVPLTILGVPNGWSSIAQWTKNLVDGLLLIVLPAPYPRWLVVEVGADRPGDISRALSWLTPSVVVATRIPEVPVHVEFYASPEDVAREELFPLSRLLPGSVAVVNEDEETTRTTPLPEGVRRMSYGFSKDAEVRASHYRVLSKNGLPDGISFSVHHGSERTHVTLRGVVGHAHVYAMLGGMAGALAAGAPFSDMERVQEAHDPSPGRLRIIEGIRASVLLDDSYNASPAATEEALKTLKDSPARGRHIAVLGDMLELGSFSADEHKKVGEIVPRYADMLVAVGVRARRIAERAGESGMREENIRVFENALEAANWLRDSVGDGDVVLVKGSQSMRMERVVHALMAHPEEAPTLLARQDAEWLAR